MIALYIGPFRGIGLYREGNVRIAKASLLSNYSIILVNDFQYKTWRRPFIERIYFSQNQRRKLTRRQNYLKISKTFSNSKFNLRRLGIFPPNLRELIELKHLPNISHSLGPNKDLYDIERGTFSIEGSWPDPVNTDRRQKRKAKEQKSNLI